MQFSYFIHHLDLLAILRFLHLLVSSILDLLLISLIDPLLVKVAYLATRVSRRYIRSHAITYS